MLLRDKAYQRSAKLSDWYSMFEKVVGVGYTTIATCEIARKELKARRKISSGYLC